MCEETLGFHTRIATRDLSIRVDPVDFGAIVNHTICNEAALHVNLAAGKSIVKKLAIANKALLNFKINQTERLTSTAAQPSEQNHRT